MGCCSISALKAASLLPCHSLKSLLFLRACFSFYLICASFVFVSFAFFLYFEKKNCKTITSQYILHCEADRDCSMFIVSVSRNAFWCNPHIQTQTHTRIYTSKKRKRDRKRPINHEPWLFKQINHRSLALNARARSHAHTHSSMDRKWDRESQWT